MTSTESSVRYNVYLPDSRRARCAPFYVKEGADVRDLEKKIRDEWSHRQALKDDDPILLKCGVLLYGQQSLYDNAMEWIRKNYPAAEMLSSDDLERYFPNGPAPRTERKIDVVVVTSPILESPDVLYELPDRRAFNISKARLSMVARFTDLPSPSACVCDVDGIKKINDEIRGIHAHRPAGNYGPPTLLFNHILARLKHRLDHLDQLAELEPSCYQLSQSHKFNLAGSDVYDGEKNREYILRPFFEGLIGGGDVSWQYRLENNKGIVDVIWGDPPRVIGEIKNEDGLGGQPTLQGVASFAKIVSQPGYEDYVARSNCPVIIIGMMGPRLEISTAVFTNGIYVDKLLSQELILGAWHADDVLRLGRIMKAVSLSSAELKEYYDMLKRNLQVKKDASPTTAHLYPDPLPAVEGSRIPTLTYVAKLSHTGEHLDILQAAKEKSERPYALYLAKMVHEHSTGDESTHEVDVVVKFTPWYNERAHRILAERQLAPTLHFCARIVGGLYMVVMEHVKGKPLWRAPIPLDYTDIYEDLTRAIHLLHEENLVFGDLRLQNTICKPEGGAMLVDFDWVGEHGIDRYPASLNDDDPNRWAEGVGRRTIMDKEHDKVMLKKVRAFLEEAKGTSP